MRLLHVVLSIVLFSSIAAARPLDQSLKEAGENRLELVAALHAVPLEQRPGMRWLIEHMPVSDLHTLRADFLLENVALAYEAWHASPWHESVPERLFFDTILPYASINERRDDWRADFRNRFAPLVAHARSPAEAAAVLNNAIFKHVGVKYSTARPKPDQSPLESIEAGMASCTGLSVLLVDACRSVGVPARFAGTALWSDNSGNHSWVEVWDDGTWHFTGAAEPTGDALDRAWFADRAAGATEGDPRHGIYAVTWRDVPLHFPMVWLPGDESVGAVDVTWRYVTRRSAVAQGQARVRVKVTDRHGECVSVSIVITDDQQTEIARGMSRDDRFDANDYWTTMLPLGSTVVLQAGDGSAAVRRTIKVEHDEQLVTVPLPRYGINEVPDDKPLSSAEAKAVRGRRLRDWRLQRADERRVALGRGVIEVGGVSMPVAWRVEGTAPASGRSLYISLHGGGGAPTQVNDRQWRNQQHLYDIVEGVYVAPRAPTDTWNLWHQSHIDPLLDRLIQDMILVEGVDPDRVYLMGYSAGGDGVYQLAPRMADRFGAAAMMAGHPNETKPDGLRNLPFTIHVGGRDSGYDRNRKALEWKQALAELAARDEGGYPHEVVVYPDKGHWMDGEDAAGVRWMAGHVRNLRPQRIVWLQDDVLHKRFYWLKVDDPVARDRVVVSRNGQTMTVEEPGAAKTLRIRLDDDMLDLSQPVTVLDAAGATLFEGWVPRTADVIERTLAERGDPRGVFLAEIVVEIR